MYPNVRANLDECSVKYVCFKEAVSEKKVWLQEQEHKKKELANSAMRAAVQTKIRHKIT